MLECRTPAGLQSLSVPPRMSFTAMHSNKTLTRAAMRENISVYFRAKPRLLSTNHYIHAGIVGRAEHRKWPMARSQDSGATQNILKHILRPIQKRVSWLPDHLKISVNMTFEIVIFSLGFWIELP